MKKSQRLTLLALEMPVDNGVSVRAPAALRISSLKGDVHSLICSATDFRTASVAYGLARTDALLVLNESGSIPPSSKNAYFCQVGTDYRIPSTRPRNLQGLEICLKDIKPSTMRKFKTLCARARSSGLRIGVCSGVEPHKILNAISLLTNEKGDSLLEYCVLTGAVWDSVVSAGLAALLPKYQSMLEAP